jgi:glucose-6-phosphate isomerase
LFDFSKNLVDKKAFQLLLALAEECQLKDAIEKMFTGDLINQTENRAVLHTALRNFGEEKIIVNGKSIDEDVQRVLNQMKVFSENYFRRTQRLFRKRNHRCCKHRDRRF